MRVLTITRRDYLSELVLINFGNELDNNVMLIIGKEKMFHHNKSPL